MNFSTIAVRFCSCLLAGLAAATASGMQAASADRSEQVVAAAEDLLKVLSAEQRTAVQFRFNDDEQRVRWSNLPSGIFARRGLRMGDLNAQQRQAVYDVVRATLSPAGYQAVLDNVAADEQLKSGAGRGRVIFGSDEFYFSLLGQPSRTEAWMWQFGGHHLAVNATVIGPRITLGPTLTGGQPMRYKAGERQVSQMSEEIALAAAFVQSLTAEQRGRAVLGGRFGDMLLGPGKDGVVPRPEGLRGADLSPEQRQQLVKLVMLRVNLLNEEDAQERRAEVEQGLDDTWFSWRGALTADGAASYRVQGPGVFLEYAPQAMGGAPAEHIHAMYREFGNDYGQRWFQESTASGKPADPQK
ncbi:MAG: DUF3500 domain-containing protein [Planctomyces sp.]